MNDWDWVPLGRLFERQQRPVDPSDAVVTAFRDGQVALRSRRRAEGYTEALQEIGYQGIRRGDLVIHAMDAFAGAIGVAEDDGKSSPVYSALTPRKNADPRFYAYYLRHYALSGGVAALAQGIRERSTDFRWATAKTVPVPALPPQRQRQIADYLDHETAEIDAFIADLAILGSQMEEHRRAKLDRLVTLGVEVAPSTVTINASYWPPINAGWETARLGSLVSTRKDLVGESWASYELLSLTLRGVVPRDLINRVGKLPSDFLSYQSVRVDDFVFCLFDVEETPRTIGLSKREGMVTGAYTVASVTTPRVRPEYLELAYLSRDQRKALRPLYAGLRNTIRSADFRAVSIPLPTLDEQDRIVRAYRQESKDTEALASDIDATVALARERRAALITAAVTGQIDITAKQAPVVDSIQTAIEEAR